MKIILEISFILKNLKKKYLKNLKKKHLQKNEKTKK